MNAMNVRSSLAVLPVLAFVLLSVERHGHALTLVEDGEPIARIYVAAGAPDDECDAADEMARVLAIMSGARLPVIEAADRSEIHKTAVCVVLGALAEEMGLTMNRSSRASDGYRYQVNGNRLLLVAESPRGVYLGVNNLLETLGCGWYAPGAIGEVIPRRATISVPDDLDCTRVSNSINRRYWYGGKNSKGEANTAWLRRLNGDYMSGSWSHAWARLVPKELFQEHPEYFSLYNGERTARQLCTTSRDTIHVAAASLIDRMRTKGAARLEPSETLVYPAGPNDGGGLCQCSECAALDTPGYVEPSSGKRACSTRVFQFAADLAQITSREFPEKDLGILVYSDYSRVPQKMKKLHPNVFPMIAPIRRCRFHGLGNPNCRWSSLLREEIHGWANVSCGKLGFYIYNYNLADSLLPFSKITYYKELVGEVNKLDVEQLAWVFETIDSWAMHAPHMYLSVRLSWDSTIDIDAEMDRYFRGFYGEAAEPMKTYWLNIDRAYAQASTCTGACYGQHHIWTDQLLASSRADIEKAKQLARSDRVKQAVAMAEAGLRCAELFVQIWRNVGEFDFLAAAEAKDTLKDHVAAMSEKPEPHWAHERYAFGYLQRFLGLTIDDGAKILADGGKIVGKLPDVWRFSRDERAMGTELGWFRPGFDDSHWSKLATYWQSWDDQELATYHGDAWYRTSFLLPADAKGRDLRLWFGGFDHNVDVYLNGHHLGERRGFVKPQEFSEITNCLKFGEHNLLAVRVSAGDLAELGTGGIMMPVMIYAAPALGMHDGSAGRPGQVAD
ncbi:MAG: DUF4838 domain-containing protein [Planctomycetes bacterium]|nr:DUF4838 domain-containing protein [Planctomycetota bacterium]MBL7041850.1 DUF4838 domain-containing protein [Pirellulaceae bacterium]